MKVQFSTRSKHFRVAVACAAAAVAGPVAVAAMPAAAGAADGTIEVTCFGALDDTDAVYTESVGWMSTYAALYGGGGPATGVPSSWPSAPMSYSLTGLGETVDPGAGALPVSFTWGGDASVTDAITDWLEPYLGMTAAPADPIVTTVDVTGPATVSGLSSTTTGTIPLDPSAAAAPVTVSGTVTPTGTGSLSMSVSQRITLVIGKDIDYNGTPIRVETLTFDCTSDPLPAVYVVAPGAPLARIDDFPSGLTVDTGGSVSGTSTFDVLANDEATASALDPTSLTVVDSGPLTTSVVDGKIVVTGTTDPAGWLNDPTIAGCVGIDQSSQTSGTEALVTTVYDCIATVEYSICTVDDPPLCSTTQAMIPFTKSDVQTDTTVLPELVPVPVVVPATPVPATPSYTG